VAFMAKLIHQMIRVVNPDAAIAFYSEAFGLQESHRLDFPDFTLIYLREPESGFEIELTWNKGRTEPYPHGSAYGHIAFATTALDSCRDRLQRLGFTPGEIKTLSAPSGSARFFFVTDPDGYKIEVLENGGHYV
jgi:lactoylglutathione lyase